MQTANSSSDVLIGLGCDYITVTASDADRVGSLHSLGSELFRNQSLLGNEVRAWGMAGFKGWKCGSVQVGTRMKEVILRLSSDSAHSSWTTAFRLADNVSRLDLQATLKITDGPTRRIERHRRAARKHASAHNDIPIVRWVQEHAGGLTLYLGARESICFGRIYDKYAQSKLDCYRQCVRYEVQFHNRLARTIAAQLDAQPSPLPSTASYISQFFSARGVSLILPHAAGARYSCTRNRSDVDKHLAWLRKAVRPCVLSLIASGDGAEALAALGLVVDGPTVDHTAINN